MKAIFVLIVAFLAVQATDFYVAQDGTTTPCGSEASPCASMLLALNQMIDGDSMILLPGTLTGSGNNGLTVNISLTITSPSQNTTIDLQGLGRAFTFLSGNVEISGVIFTGGLVEDDLPASVLSFYGNTLTIDNCQFTNNTWSSQHTENADPIPAGAIYINSGAAFISNSKFYSNRANTAIGEGGAISVGDANLNVTFCYFELNVAATGGAIYSASDSYDTPSIIGISDSNFYHNLARLGGGAIRDDGNVYTYLDNCQFEHNLVIGWGGAYYGHGTISWISNTRFFNNTGESNGGAIYLEDNARAILNKVVVDTAYVIGYTGGCVCLIGSELYATDSVFTNCDAFNEGGGFYVVADPAQLVLERVNITNCDAGEGGGIFTDAFAKIYLTDVIITNNTADDSGGGVYCNQATIHIEGNTIIEGNTAGNSFGGIADNFYCAGEPEYYFCEIKGDAEWKGQCKSEETDHSSDWPSWLDGIPKWVVVVFSLSVIFILLFLVVCGVCIVRQTRKKNAETKKSAAIKRFIKTADEEELLNDYDE